MSGGSVDDWVGRYEKRNLFLVLSGRFESILGVAALSVALPLYVLDLTKSATVMGLVSFLGLVPRLVVLPFGGVIGDKVNRKWWMVLMDELHGLLMLSVWFLTRFRAPGLFVVAFLVVVSAIIDGLFSGPTAAMFGDVVRKEHMKVATSLNAMTRALALIVGPVLGGVLYGRLGFSNVILFTGVLYVFSGITEMFIVYPTVKRNGGGKILQDILEGVGFVWSNRGIRYLFTFAIVLNFILSPLFSVVFPYLTRVVFKLSSTQYGSLQTFATAGALLGNILIVLFLRAVSSRSLVNLGLLMQTAFSVALSVFILVVQGLSNRAAYVVFSSAFAVISFFNVLVNTPLNASLQLLVPSELRSRVFSVLELLASCMIPLSSLLYGYLLDKVPPLWFFFAMNVAGFFVALAFILGAPKGVFDTVSAT